MTSIGEHICEKAFTALPLIEQAIINKAVFETIGATNLCVTESGVVFGFWQVAHEAEYSDPDSQGSQLVASFFRASRGCFRALKIQTLIMSGYSLKIAIAEVFNLTENAVLVISIRVFNRLH